ncbi:acyl-CoA thioesterase [Deinococcus radiophilus]|uniref:Acyl-CoA thioesterase n=1 Tax=Deinococcus radiophilus TaxID=32062 RepID=A0A3S0IAH8_9DEIO|nr:thioesterase family protein [Deinococcus radiophilus]RTR29016.1 acyl-CoA thioesterase [Deinococcus radiophilus]UFA49601.1 acyl-CoA thioesterase [Deinococcus radiophilus]
MTSPSGRTHALAALNWDAAHHTPIQTRYSDTDAMGHLNNGTYIIYLETARVEMLRGMGLSLTDIRTVLARVELDYVAEIKLEQDVVVDTLLERLGHSSYTFVARVTADGIPCAYARTVQVNLGEDGKPGPLGEDQRGWLSRYQAQEEGHA